MKLRLMAMAVTIVAAAQVQGAMITKTNSTDGFFDNSNGTRDLSFVLADFGGDPTTVSDVNLSIFFAKSNDNSFVPELSSITPGTPFFQEIEFVLSSPSGTSFTLISNDQDVEIVAADNFETFNTGSAGFKGTILFDQSAADPVDVDPNVISAGTFRPDDDTLGSLDVFNGESALGTWSLFIEDDVGADGLSFYEYSLTITTPSASRVPEPSSVGLLAVGMMATAIGAAWRRRQNVAVGR